MGHFQFKYTGNEDGDTAKRPKRFSPFMASYLLIFP